jgi:hypothetical protein
VGARRLPIVDEENRPIGLLSVDDIARYAVREKEIDMEHDVIETLASIAKPRKSAAGASAQRGLRPKRARDRERARAGGRSAPLQLRSRLEAASACWPAATSGF